MKKLLFGMCIMSVGFCHAEGEPPKDYSGFYAGVGASWQSTTSKVAIDDNLGSALVNRIDAHGTVLYKGSVSKLGGAGCVGYGDFITGNFYVGGEIAVDVGGSKSSSVSAEYASSSNRIRGVVPCATLRCGGYVPQVCSLVYLRFGFCQMKNKFESPVIKTDVTCNTVSPFIGLGIERKVLSHLNFRIEYDYRFSVEKNKSDLQLYGSDGSVVPGGKGAVNSKVRGEVIRVMGVYHF